MHYSISRIAKELGVSKVTVSLVLNGKAQQARISGEMEKRILDFCHTVNYVPNIHAQRLNSKTSQTIGFLVDQATRVDDDNPFSDYVVSSIFGGAVTAAQRMDYRIAVQLYSQGMEEERVFNWLRSNEVGGLIYYGLDMPEKWKQVFAEEKRSIVGIGVQGDPSISTVNIDNFGASYALTQYLIDRGRRSFLYFAGTKEGFVSEQRQQGFLAACQNHGIPVSADRVRYGNYSEAIAANITRDLDLTGTDAIVCANDDMALGVLSALKERGIAVPAEIAVVGGDNILLGRYCAPGLTTFDLYPQALGTAAVECMSRMLAGEKRETVVLDSKLLVRESG